MRKKLFAFNKSLIVLAVIVFLLTEGSNVTKVKAQESKEQKCEKLYECYRSYYNGCFENLLQDFVPRKVDNFGVIDLNYEWAKLDNLAAEFRNNPESQIYIVVYGGKVNKTGEFKERTKRIAQYLTQNRKIDPKKISVINGGFREKFEFELWLSLSAKIFPSLTPTVDPEKVVFKGKMKPLPLDLGN